jgi:hypothetical protein
VIYKKCHKSFIKRKFQVVFCSSGDDGGQYLLETGSPSGTLSLSTLSGETTHLHTPLQRSGIEQQTTDWLAALGYAPLAA